MLVHLVNQNTRSNSTKETALLNNETNLGTDTTCRGAQLTLLN